MNMRVASSHQPDMAQRLDRLRDLDSFAHDALAQALPQAQSQNSHDGLVILVDLMSQVVVEAPQAARVFAERIRQHPWILGDADGLRRWVLHGMKQRGDSKRMLQHFERTNPEIFADEELHRHTEHVLDSREALLSYVAGFGVETAALELHEPVAASTQQPAPTIGDNGILLPRRFDFDQAEQRELLFRAMMAHAVAHLRFSPRARSTGNRRPNLIALTALVEDARVERLMLRDHPGLHSVWSRFHTASKSESGFGLDGLMARLARALHEPSYEDPNPWVAKGRELFEEAAARDLTDIAAFDRMARELALVVGKMRLQLPRPYRPSPVYRDDNAVLWSKDQALPVDETIEAEVEAIEYRPANEVPTDQDLSGLDLRRRYPYPEWDAALQELREEWTTVIEDVSARSQRQAGLPQPTRGLRKSLTGRDRIPDRSIHLKHLPEGDDLDLNAAIDSAVDRRLGLTPDGRIFRRHGRRPKSSSIIILMDTSISTDRFAAGSFTRVLDLEKQAAVTVTEGLDGNLTRVAVHAFASNGRHEVHYRSVKDFDEPFDEVSRNRLQGLTSGMSTRMGTAIRHATRLLKDRQSDNQIILVLTDGQPSDIDVLDSDYLLEDTHHAVVTAAAQHVRTFCLTLDRRADDHARRIFGDRNYLISERASDFAGSAGEVLIRMLAP